VTADTLVDIDKTGVGSRGAQDSPLLGPIHGSVHAVGDRSEDRPCGDGPVKPLGWCAGIHQVLPAADGHNGGDLGSQFRRTGLELPCALLGKQEQDWVASGDVHCLVYIPDDIGADVGDILYGKQVTHHGGYLAEPFVDLVLQVVHDHQLACHCKLSALDEREPVVGGTQLSVDDSGMGGLGGGYCRVDVDLGM